MPSEKPKVCPKCDGKKIKSVPETHSGLKPWRCLRPGCGAIGYGDRVVGDPTVFDPDEPPPRKHRRDRYQSGSSRRIDRPIGSPRL